MKSFKDYARILDELGEIDSKNLNIRFKEAAEIDHKTDQIFIQPLIKTGDKTWMAKDELLAEIANVYEAAGFIMGFIRAMYLMHEVAEAQEEAKAV